MFTKTANEFLKNLKSDTLRDVKSPISLALGAYMVGSGNQSVGGAAGFTGGMAAANSIYNHASKKYIIPKLEGLASKLPGRFGGAAKAAIDIGNGIAGFIAQAVAGGVIGNAAEKYAPIYKRKAL